MVSIAVAALLAPLSTYLIWPPPASLRASGASLAVDARLRIETSHKSERLTRTVSRYSALLHDAVAASAPAATEPALRAVRITVTDPHVEDELQVSARSCYNYSISIRRTDPIANVTTCSVFGAAYALEGLLQLTSSGRLVHGDLTINDAPSYGWRGLMIDSGRRFFPVPLVENLLDTMAAVKLNVLHLHAADMCRWGVESKTYPNLTASLTGIHAGHYTQADIKALIGYAADRGIRVVPEFDVPGHSRGLIPLESEGLAYCEPSATSRSQLYDDPAGKTYDVVHALMKEMSEVFTDEVFDIGCDETGVKGPCTLESTFGFERRLATAVKEEMGKTPEGACRVLPPTHINALVCPLALAGHISTIPHLYLYLRTPSRLTRPLSAPLGFTQAGKRSSSTPARQRRTRSSTRGRGTLPPRSPRQVGKPSRARRAPSTSLPPLRAGPLAGQNAGMTSELACRQTRPLCS
jgi:hypothetical protein